MPRRRIEDWCPFNRGDRCLVNGMVKGRSLHVNATFIKMQKPTADGDEQCLVQILGGDPWSKRTDVTLVVPLGTLKRR